MMPPSLRPRRLLQAHGLQVPVRTDVSVDCRPAAVEATAYFIVAEALTNVVKHARASRATVIATIGDGVLTLVVGDDGAGGANPDGHGLVGIADRVDALAGSLRIEPGAVGGTVLTARVPLTT